MSETKTKLAKETVHAMTGRGAEIIRRHKDNTWYLKRGSSKTALTVQEAAYVAFDGYVFPGREGGEQFEHLLAELRSRTVYKDKKPKAKSKKNKSELVSV